jgi:peptide/nickel transport system substrate-binding protein
MHLSRISSTGRRATSTLLLLAMLVAGTAGAGSGRVTASSARLKTQAASTTLTWGVSYLPRTLFVPTDYSTLGSWVMVLIQGQMLTYGPQQQLQPAILSSWKQESPTKFVYTVRPGVKFSDGNPVTATDIAYTLGLQLDPKVAAQEAALFSSVKSVTATDPGTVTMLLKHPDSLVQYLPASICGFVYEKKSVEANLQNYGTPQVATVGAGPYMVQQYVPDSQITLVRNPYYYGTKPKWDTIVFKAIPDAQTMLLALRSGEIDGTFSVQAAMAQQYKAFSHVQSYPADYWQSLTLDMNESPFNNLNVRKALAYATDSAGIQQAVMRGYGRVAVTLNDPSIYAASLPAATVSKAYATMFLNLPFDLAKAKAALAASPVPHGFSTTLNVPTDSLYDTLASQILKNDWAKIGVNLTLRLMPGGPRFQIILNHKKDLGVQMIGNSPDAPDPHEMPWEYFNCDQAVFNGNNSSNYCNPKVDALLKQSLTATPASKAAMLTIQAAALASQAVPVINLGWNDQVIAVKNGWSFSNLHAFTPWSLWLNDLNS